MGQNFLVDDTVLAKIIEAADIKPADTIVEVGPGLGVLTDELAKKAGKVIAIEKDDKLAELLAEKFQIARNKSQTNSKLEILNEDALEVNIGEILKQVQDDKTSYKLVANIPYNITSPIIRKFLEAENKPELMVLLVQKEVAERITAKPGEMSLLSVSVQFYAEAEIIDIVKNSSFFPVPKVDSAIIRFRPKASTKGRWASGPDQPMAEKIKEKSFFRLVKFGFAARRKTLENNLSAGLQITKAQASDIIKSTGLSELTRAQDLAVSDWIKLYKQFG